MPQPGSLKGQRGSALAAVLGLSVAISLAAGSYLLVVTNADRNSDLLEQDGALTFAAESGVLLGARYITRHDSLDFAALAVGTPYSLAGWSPMDGFQVKVDLHKVTAPNRFAVESWATRGAGGDTLVARMDVLITLDADGPADDSCVIALSNWQTSLRLAQ